VELLLRALAEARQRGYPEAGQIAGLLKQFGVPAEVLEARPDLPGGPPPAWP
jgi:hypothetical protein